METEQKGRSNWYRRAAEAPRTELWPGVTRRTMVWGERTMLCAMEVAAGQVVQAHSHPHEQIGYVAKGKLRFIVDGQVANLEAGDAYLIPGGAAHEVHGLEDSVAIDIFSPPREEYKE